MALRDQHVVEQGVEFACSLRKGGGDVVDLIMQPGLVEVFHFENGLELPSAKF
jgi:hypothetical protein